MLHHQIIHTPFALNECEIILKGPFSSIYGTNAMGGVVNIITHKSKDKIHGNVSLFGGSYQTMAGSFNLGGRFEDIFF